MSDNKNDDFLSEDFKEAINRVANIQENVRKMAEAAIPKFDSPKFEVDIPSADIYDTLSNYPELDFEVHNPTWDLVEMQGEANELLGQIAENTSVLKEIVAINRETQLSTEKLNEVMQEIHKIAKAQNKEEADTFFSKALEKINGSGEAVGNIANLVSLAMGIYQTVNVYWQN